MVGAKMMGKIRQCTANPYNTAAHTTRCRFSNTTMPISMHTTSDSPLPRVEMVAVNGEKSQMRIARLSFPLSTPSPVMTPSRSRIISIAAMISHTANNTLP